MHNMLTIDSMSAKKKKNRPNKYSPKVLDRRLMMAVIKPKMNTVSISKHAVTQVPINKYFYRFSCFGISWKYFAIPQKAIMIKVRP